MPAETPAAGSPGASAEDAPAPNPPGPVPPARKVPPEKMGAGGESARRSPRPAGSESEKDSGFSDTSSDYLSALEQTDTEELPGRRLPAQRPRPGRPFASLAPVYIVKNLLLKQPLGASSDARLVAWSGRPPPEPARSRARLLLLPQPLPTAALRPLLPGPKKHGKDTSGSGLSAYPRIVPHPGRPRDARGAAAKRFRVAEAWEAAAGEAAIPAPSGSGGGSAPGAEEEAETEHLRPSGKSAGKQRRFRNTVEILRRSGLLGITLRTKELLRQNGSTQRELAELREHARLLAEAARTNDARAWARLQRAVALTAAYWARRAAEPPGTAAAAATADLGDGEPPGPAAAAALP